MGGRWGGEETRRKKGFWIGCKGGERRKVIKRDRWFYANQLSKKNKGGEKGERKELVGGRWDEIDGGVKEEMTSSSWHSHETEAESCFC